MSLRDEDVPPESDSGFAAWLADKAGELLVELRNRKGFDDPRALRDAGDRCSHELLVDAFAKWRPDDAVLSEEGERDSAADRVRLSSDRVWIVDPLDGTREYGEPGRTDWAVHIALWTRDAGLTAGAVALPAQDVVLHTGRPAEPRPIPDRRIRIVTSRSRPPGLLPEVATALDAELLPMGSAGAKVAAVVEGTADAYVHAGGQYEWDSAAPVAVALATGHYASRLDGSTLEYNRPNPLLPDLVVSRPEIAPRLLAALADVL